MRSLNSHTSIAHTAQSKKANSKSNKLLKLSAIAAFALNLAAAEPTAQATTQATQASQTAQTATQANQTPAQATQVAQNTAQSTSAAEETAVLEASVVSATGYEQAVKDAPASISVITNEDLSTRPVKDIGEAIEDVPGVDVSLNKTGTYDYSIRGFGSEYTLVLIDGKRQSVANGFYGNGFGGSESGYMPPMNMIERIEVIRGPASTLYGTDAVGGVINIITKKNPNEITAGIELGGQLQQHDDLYGNSRNLNLYFGTPIIKDKLSVLFRTKYYKKNSSKTLWPTPVYQAGTGGAGDTQRPANFQIPSHNPGAFESLNFGAKLNYTINDANNVYLDYDRFVNTINTRSTSGRAIAVKRMLFKDNVVLNHDGDYGFGRTNEYIQYGRTKDRDYQIKSEIWVAEGKTIIPFDFKDYGALMATFGARVDYEVINNKNSSAGSEIRGKDLDQTTAALYSEGEYFITDNLIFTAGLRYNYSDLFHSELTPRAYAIYHLNDNIAFRAGIAKGYKTPAARDLTDGAYSIGTDTASFGNANLKPESSTNYEIGVDFNAFDYANYTITGFLTDFKNELSTEEFTGTVGGVTCDGNTMTCSRAINYGKTRASGVEFSMNTAKFYGFSLDSTYTFMSNKFRDDTRNPHGGRRIVNKPNHIVMAKLNYENGPWSSFFKFRGRFDTIAQRKGGGAGAITNEHGVAMKKYKPFYIFDLGVSHKFDKHQSLSFMVYNLFDKDFLDPILTGRTASGNPSGYANRYQDYTEGRSFWLSYKYDF